jgi:hypothetical protein
MASVQVADVTLLSISIELLRFPPGLFVVQGDQISPDCEQRIASRFEAKSGVLKCNAHCAKTPSAIDGRGLAVS